jgi:DNA-nicking Smr family endonuclease|tara:strand:- start:1859 stop:2275 length:417 start_codon:yes stop_codon:yes gene_type:complete
VKKKDILSKKDLEDWKNFIEDTSQLTDKDTKPHSSNFNNLTFKFDLHGFTLEDANKKVKDIILSCIKKNLREILLITGKGLHSRDNDVFKSSKFSKLKYSVPEYINSEPEIASKVLSVTTPAEKDGGEGAILIKLKKL